MELGFNSDLIKKWRRMIKREAAKSGESFNPSTTLEVQFLRNLIEEFLEVVICTSLFLEMLVVPPAPPKRNVVVCFHQRVDTNKLMEFCFYFCTCSRYLIPKSYHQIMVSTEWIKFLMLIELNTLMMLVFCTVRGLLNFLLTS